MTPAVGVAVVGPAIMAGHRALAAGTRRPLSGEQNAAPIHGLLLLGDDFGSIKPIFQQLIDVHDANTVHMWDDMPPPGLVELPASSWPGPKAYRSEDLAGSVILGLEGISVSQTGSGHLRLSMPTPYRREAFVEFEVHNPERIPAFLHAWSSHSPAHDEESIVEDPVDAVIEYLKTAGFTNVRRVDAADEGIDLAGDGIVVKVRGKAKPLKIAVVQRTYGIACAEESVGMVFSRGALSPETLNWASRVGMPAFGLDAHGAVLALNDVSTRLREIAQGGTTS